MNSINDWENCTTISTNRSVDFEFLSKIFFDIYLYMLLALEFKTIENK